MDSSQSSEYAVSGVRYDSNRCRLYTARVHRVRAGSVDPPMDVPRAVIVNEIELGTTFMAITLDADGRYTARARVRLVEVAGESFLRCDADPLPVDDLLGVLEF